MKKLLLLLLFVSLIFTSGCQKSQELPLPELDEGMRGQLGIDKNINEATIDKYLGRDDAVYRDMRMLKDEANYEAIGGDSYLSGFVKGFEVVPYPYLCNVSGLPEEVGSSYTGTTLFTENDGEYTANYEESMTILETLFPKDKIIFLMCGGGGYSGMTKNMLVSLGWDGDRIYNTGGYWYYDGENNVDIRYASGGKEYRNYALLDYHHIDFSLLHSLNGESGGSGDDKPQESDDSFIRITSVDDLKKLESEKKTFALYVYMPGCVSCASFAPVVREFTEKNGITMYAVELSVLSKTSNSVSDRLSYTPSMFIYKDGEVVAYLDPASNDDLPYYETVEGLRKWFDQYIENLSADELDQLSQEMFGIPLNNPPKESVPALFAVW